MHILKFHLNRRTFIKHASIQLLILVVGLHMKYFSTDKVVQAASQNQAFGSGAYGQGVYPGHRVYLPFITKEGK